MMAEPRAKFEIEADLRAFTESIRQAVSVLRPLSDAEVQATRAARLLEDQTRATTRVGAQYFEVTKDQTEGMKLLASAYNTSLKPSEKTAEMLERLQRETTPAIKATKEYARAIEHLTSKQADQARREAENKGRSLSMLFDEQNKILALLPGRLGEVSRAYLGLKEGAAKAAEGLSKLMTTGEAGFSAIGAQVAILGTLTVAAVAAGAAVVAMAAQAGDAINRLDDLSMATGISVEELSRLKGVAVEVDGGIDLVAKAAAKLAVLQGKSAEGNEEATRTLAMFGGELSDTTLELLRKLSDSYTTMSSTGDRARLANRALGDELALKMAPALALGAQGFDEAVKKAERFGVVVDGEALEAARRYDSAMNDLKLSLEGFSTASAPALAFLSAMVDKFTAIVGGSRMAVGAIADLFAAGKDDVAVAREQKNMMADVAASWRDAEPAAFDLAKAEKKAAEAAAEWSRQLAAAESTARALVDAGLGPVTVATAKYEAGVEALNILQDAGRISQQEYNAGLFAAIKALNDVETAAQSAGLTMEMGAVSASVATSQLYGSILDLGGAVEDFDAAQRVAMKDFNEAQERAAERAQNVSDALGAAAQVAQSFGAGPVAGILALSAALYDAIKAGETLQIVLASSAIAGAGFAAIAAGVRGAAESALGMSVSDFLSGDRATRLQARRNLATQDVGAGLIDWAANVEALAEALEAHADEIGQSLGKALPIIARILVIEVGPALVKLALVMGANILDAMTQGFRDRIAEWGSHMGDVLRIAWIDAGNAITEGLTRAIREAWSRLIESLKPGGEKATDAYFPASNRGRTVTVAPGDDVFAVQRGGMDHPGRVGRAQLEQGATLIDRLGELVALQREGNALMRSLRGGGSTLQPALMRR